MALHSASHQESFSVDVCSQFALWGLPRRKIRAGASARRRRAAAGLEENEYVQPEDQQKLHETPSAEASLLPYIGLVNPTRHLRIPRQRN